MKKQLTPEEKQEARKLVELAGTFDEENDNDSGLPLRYPPHIEASIRRLEELGYEH